MRVVLRVKTATLMAAFSAMLLHHGCVLFGAKVDPFPYVFRSGTGRAARADDDDLHAHPSGGRGAREEVPSAKPFWVEWAMSKRLIPTRNWSR